MKKILSIFLIMILIMIDVPVVKAESKDFDYIIDKMEFSVDKGLGYKYEYIGYFSEGFALVKKDGKYGFIDKTGKLVIPAIYEKVQPFSEGLAAVGIGVTLEDIYKNKDIENKDIEDEDIENKDIKDRLRKSIIDHFNHFKTLPITVKIVWGFIDKTGKLVIPAIYDDVQPFSEGLAAVEKNGKCGFIDKNGEEIVPPVYDWVSDFNNGFAIIEKDRKFGFIDKTGKEIVSPIYESMPPSSKWYLVYLSSFNDGLAAVRENKKWGFIDKTGKLVIPTIYEDIQPFREGLAAVKKDGKWGFIDKKGKLVIPAVFYSASWFNEGLASFDKVLKTEQGVVYKSDVRSGFIDRTGKIVIPAIYEEVQDFSEGLAAVKKNEKWGFIDKTGKTVIPFIYDEVVRFIEGLAAVKKNGKWGFIDKTGKELVPLIYDNINMDFYKRYYFSDGVLVAEKDREWGIIVNPLNVSKYQDTVNKSEISAIPTASRVLIDGKEFSFEAYNIDGYNYFKLRDLAKALNGTGKQFGVEWEAVNNVIRITSGKKYKEVGGELSISGNKQIKNAVPTASKVYVNGKEVSFTTYNIGGYNYFKLRDIAAALEFGVTWDASTNTIGIDSSN